MPRIFNEHERKAMEAKIILSARKLFERQGYSKTSVSEITKSVGIAAGTFYNFFDSKEALFFEIMGEAEQEKFKLIKQIFTLNGDPKVEFLTFLNTIFIQFIEDPIYTLIFEENLYEKIVKKVSQEKLLLHMKYDIDAAKEILQSVHRRNFLVSLSPEELVSQLRALFMITLHQEDLGVEDMVSFMQKQIEIFVEGLSIVYGVNHD